MEQDQKVRDREQVEAKVWGKVEAVDRVASDIGDDPFMILYGDTLVQDAVLVKTIEAARKLKKIFDSSRSGKR